MVVRYSVVMCDNSFTSDSWQPFEVRNKKAIPFLYFLNQDVIWRTYSHFFFFLLSRIIHIQFGFEHTCWIYLSFVISDSIFWIVHVNIFPQHFTLWPLNTITLHTGPMPSLRQGLALALVISVRPYQRNLESGSVKRHKTRYVSDESRFSKDDLCQWEFGTIRCSKINKSSLLCLYY